MIILPCNAFVKRADSGAPTHPTSHSSKCGGEITISSLLSVLSSPSAAAAAEEGPHSNGGGGADDDDMLTTVILGARKSTIFQNKFSMCVMW